jgi:hypothetical protein
MIIASQWWFALDYCLNFSKVQRASRFEQYRSVDILPNERMSTVKDVNAEQ